MLSPIELVGRSAGWFLLPTVARDSSKGAGLGGEGLDGLLSIGALGPTESRLFLTLEWFLR